MCTRRSLRVGDILSFIVDLIYLTMIDDVKSSSYGYVRLVDGFNSPITFGRSLLLETEEKRLDLELGNVP